MEDGWSSGIESLKLPFLKVTTWAPEQLREFIKQDWDLGFSPKKIPALWWPYWKKLIDSYL
jgi:hypothetical protein